jgi:hypothetical protein
MEVRNEAFYRFITQAKEIGQVSLRTSNPAGRVNAGKPIDNVDVMNLEE